MPNSFSLYKYDIQWERVKDFEDLKRIIKVLRISFETDFVRIEEIKDLVELVSKETGQPWPGQSDNH